MSKWQIVKLGEIGEAYIGLTYKPEDVSESGTIVLRSGNIQNNKIDLTTGIVRVQKTIKEKLFVNTGDILICSRNGSANLVGKSAIIENISEKMSFGAFMMIYKSSYNNYIKHFLISPYFKRQLNKSATSTINQITKGMFDEVKIPLPPLEEQQKIAKNLDLASELVKLYKTKLSELDKLIQSVFYDMFGDPVTNEKEWEVKPLHSICSNILGGGTPSKSNLEFYIGDIPWVTPKDMKCNIITDSIDHINEEAIKKSSVKLIPSHSIIMVIRSGILKRTLPVAINMVPVTINQDMKAFVTNAETNIYFLLYTFKMWEKYLLGNVRAVTADNIEFSIIKNLLTIAPPLPLQQKFADIVTKIEEQKTEVNKTLKDAEMLYNSLMQEYFE